MSRDELAELLLAYLYDKAEAEPHGFFFFSLEEFAKAAHIEDRAELLTVARLAEEGGLVMLSQDMFGQVSALINLEGSSYVEKGGETGIIAKYRENPSAFIKEDDEPQWFNEAEMNIVQFTPEMMAPPPAAEAGSPEAGPPADIKPYILRIIEAILDDQSLDDVTRGDLLRDAETLNIQLAKTVRNRTVLESLMSELASVPSLAHLVAELSSFV